MGHCKYKHKHALHRTRLYVLSAVDCLGCWMLQLTPERLAYISTLNKHTSLSICAVCLAVRCFHHMQCYLNSEADHCDHPLCERMVGIQHANKVYITLR